MATGYDRSSSTYHRRSSDNDSSSNLDNSYKDRQDATVLNSMTLEVVSAFKRSLQKKIDEGAQLSGPIVELEVANIRRNKYPEECNFNQLKKSLSQDLQKCQDAHLRVSMAYGSNPHEIEHILQEKMNKSNPNNKPTDTSLNNLTGRLKSLKRELDDQSQPNVFRAIRNIDKDDINRANRLFFSEALHCIPGVKDYTFADAQNAVQAIRQTNYEADDPKPLLTIVKTARDVNDTREYLNNLSKESSIKENQSLKRSSRYSRDDDDDENNPSHRSSTKTNNNPTSTYHSKLSSTSDQNSSTKSELPTRSARFSNRDDDDDDHHHSSPSTTTYQYKPYPDTYQPPSQSSNRTNPNDTKSRDETTRSSRYNDKRQ